ncbi:hypothetical protein [Brachybacterium sacelli]|uniref:PH domain-containing protein n=1 Tax=Brachybacterium sacelli TaxID=173364 RepID=A0ABS4WV73_9MICO|nr:hypothetical protein [Brachybacterium sacelli]MBP2380106.1 hypothetical protein [Brachybacterium sacelli]
MSLHGFLRRNGGEIGRPLTIYRNGYGAGTVIGAVVLWIACSVLFLLHPDLGPVQKALAVVILAVVVVAALLLMAGEVLVVAERGLALGTSNLGRSPFVVRYDQITVGSVVPVHRSRLYARTTGRYGMTSTVRNSAWINQGIYFVGPSARDARRTGAVRGALSTSSGGSIDGRHFWFAGTGSTPPEQVTAQIAQAAGTIGLQQFARATAAAPPRELTGKRADAARLLPGFPAHR